MARMMYVCDCGFTVDSKRVKEVAAHEATCEIAQQADALEDVKDSIRYFAKNLGEHGVTTVAERILQMDTDIEDFFDEEKALANLVTVLMIKVLELEYRMQVGDQILEVPKVDVVKAELDEGTMKKLQKATAMAEREEIEYEE